MWCIRKFKIYFICFYICGLTSYIPLKKGHIKRLQVISILVKVIHVSVLIGYVTLFIINRFTQLKLMNFNAILSNYAVFYTAIANGYALYKSITTPNLSRNICGRFAGIIHYMERNLQVAIPIEKFKISFTLKIWLKLITATLCTVTLHVIASSDGIIFIHPAEEFVYIVIRHVIIMSAFHAILYISLIEVLLLSINMQLKKKLCAVKRQKTIFTSLHHLKWIHYNLWRISQMINDHFGTLFSVLLLQYSTWLIFGIYRIYTLWPGFVVLSKYNFWLIS